MKEKIERLLTIHQQWHPTSCAASGMEMLLKFEEKIGEKEYPLQRKFGGENIGYEKADILKKFGLNPVEESPSDLEALKVLVKKENSEHRILLVSTPTVLQVDLVNMVPAGIGNHHIWIGVEIENNLLLVSKSHMNNDLVQIRSMDILHQEVKRVKPDFRFDCLCYQKM